jgi:hypothetical protein
MAMTGGTSEWNAAHATLRRTTRPVSRNGLVKEEVPQGARSPSFRHGRDRDRHVTVDTNRLSREKQPRWSV